MKPDLQPPASAATGSTELRVAVFMRCELVQGPMARWQPWRWTLQEVLPQQPGFGTQARCLREGQEGAVWLYPDWPVTLHTDDAEGYWLNVTSPMPAYFVLWRMNEPEDGSEPLAQPHAVSLSYHDAGRWLDAQETVETFAAPNDVVQWTREFAEQHYVPEPKKRQRPQSFQRLTDRFGQPVSISTQGKRKGEGPQGPQGGEGA